VKCWNEVGHGAQSHAFRSSWNWTVFYPRISTCATSVVWDIISVDNNEFREKCAFGLLFPPPPLCRVLDLFSEKGMFLEP
jgi:hypothetical protein